MRAICSIAAWLCLSILAAPPVARAQQSGKVPRIGFIGSFGTPSVMRSTEQPLLAAFADLGYDEGRNVTFEFRSAEGHIERMPGVAAELVALQVDVIGPRDSAYRYRNAKRTVERTQPSLKARSACAMMAGSREESRCGLFAASPHGFV